MILLFSPSKNFSTRKMAAIWKKIETLMPILV